MGSKIMGVTYFCEGVYGGRRGQWCCLVIVERGCTEGIEGLIGFLEDGWCRRNDQGEGGGSEMKS